MRAQQAVHFSSEEERRKLTRWCGLFAALGWMTLEVLFELLFGPHIRLVRSLAIGSGIGAVAGLLTSGLQWSVLRGYVHYPGWWIPAGTAGATLAGLISGLLLYTLNQHVALFNWILPLQGASGALFVGLVTAGMQWVVLRDWTASENEGRAWWIAAVAGSALGAAGACIIVAVLTGLLGAVLEKGAWPYILLAAYVTSGFVGGLAYGGGITWGLRRVLPRSTSNPAEPGAANGALRGNTGLPLVVRPGVPSRSRKMAG